MSFDSFPKRPNIDPKIYAYSVSDKNYQNLIKIGFTNFDVKKRVKQQFSIKDECWVTVPIAESLAYEATYEELFNVQENIIYYWYIVLFSIAKPE